jgi:phosphatidylglycerol:prolipoprotein diacylglycerol transferase
VLLKIPVPFVGREIPIFGFGMMLFLAFLGGTWLARRLARREGLDPERVLDLCLWIFLGGLVGARLLFVLRNPQQFHGPLDFFKIWQGGIVFYGGVVAAIGVFWWYTRRHELPPWRVLDVLAPAIALGIGVGRFGCLLNGCCWGDVTNPGWPAALSIRFPFGSIPYTVHLEQDRVSLGFHLWPQGENAAWQRGGAPPVVQAVDEGSWAEAAGLKPGDFIVRLNEIAVARRETQQGPEGGKPLLALLAKATPGSRLELEVLRDGRTVTLQGTFDPVPPHSQPVHPTQIYLAAAGLLLLGATLAFYPFRRRHGQVMVLVMIGYAVTRFLIEFLRADEPLMADGLTMSQNISVALFAGGIGLVAWLRAHPPTVPVPSLKSPMSNLESAAP